MVKAIHACTHMHAYNACNAHMHTFIHTYLQYSTRIKAALVEDFHREGYTWLSHECTHVSMHKGNILALLQVRQNHWIHVPNLVCVMGQNACSISRTGDSTGNKDKTTKCREDINVAFAKVANHFQRSISIAQEVSVSEFASKNDKKHTHIILDASLPS